MSNKHWKLGGSTARRWINCPGSVKLSETVPPQPTGYYAAEGTVAHYVAERFLQNKQGDIFEGQQLSQDGHLITVTAEMIDYCMEYVSFVRGLVNEWGIKPEIEKEVVIDEELELGGTADCVIYVPFNRLIVIDFKYGAGVMVSAERNEQLMFYALGALQALPYEERLDIPIIEMIIVQPRGGGESISKFEMPFDEIDKWHWEILRSVNESQRNDAAYQPGDWCKWCPASAICPALKEQSLEITKRAFEQDVISVPLQQIPIVLDKAPMIRAWLDSVEQFAKQQLENGKEVPGYCLKEKYGNRKWIDATESERYYREAHFEDKEIFDISFKSPAQIEKMLKEADYLQRLERQDFLKEFADQVEKPFNGYAIVKGDSKLTTAKDAFTTIHVGE